MTDDTKKEKRVRAELPGGFRDTPPNLMAAKRLVLETARRTFESFGFEEMATPAVERTETLTGGEEESEKIIFNVRGSREDTETESGLSLRFDLTVPLARFLAANPDFPKPFKRFQIGEVWRGESPQAGRYREFTQADIDIMGSSSIEADAEVITVISQTLCAIGVENFAIKVNSRKVLDKLPEQPGFPQEQTENLGKIIREIDKAPKISMPAVLKNISTFAGDDTSRAVGSFLTKNLSLNDPELQEIKRLAESSGAKNIEIDQYIVRGLSYYTGTVFEAVLPDAPEIGSIFSGGRYDNLLVPFTGQKIPAVGASLGVDRLLAALEKLGKLPSQSPATKVLILNLSQDLKNEYLAMASELRSSGIDTATYLGDDRAFQAQLAYAVKKEIPFIVIFGEEEAKAGTVAIKNLRARSQDVVKRDAVVEYFAKKP